MSVFRTPQQISARTPAPFHRIMMEYEYADFHREIDVHNRCCGGKMWCIRDICGIICAIMTWLLILYAEFVVMYVILIPSMYPLYSVVNIVVFQTCAFLAFASHLRTMFTDPVIHATFALYKFNHADVVGGSSEG